MSYNNRADVLASKSYSGSSLYMKVELSALDSSVGNSRLESSEVFRKNTQGDNMLQTVVS